MGPQCLTKRRATHKICALPYPCYPNESVEGPPVAAPANKLVMPRTPQPTRRAGVSVAWRWHTATAAMLWASPSTICVC